MIPFSEKKLKAQQPPGPSSMWYVQSKRQTSTAQTRGAKGICICAIALQITNTIIVYIERGDGDGDQS